MNMGDKLIILNTIRGNLIVLRKLLQTEPDKNLGLTPEDCADFNKPDIIKLLCNAGAFVDDRFRKTLLHIAVAANNIESVKLLIEIGCDINSYNNRNESVLHFAVANGLNEIVELLVEKGANINEHRPKESALCCAVRIHHESLIKFLLDHGADVDNVNDDGSSPLTYAANSDSPLIILLILSRTNSNISHDSEELRRAESFNFSFHLFFQILSCNMIGDTTLGGNRYTNIKYLMEREVTCLESRSIKARALYYAVRYGDRHTVKFLIDYGAEINNSFGDYTALHHAARNRRTGDVAEYFLDSGIDVNIRNNINATPLHVAVSYGRYQICELLLSRGANVNLMDDWGKTPLNYAVTCHQSTTVKLFLEYGAKVCSKCLSNDVYIIFARFKDATISNLLIKHVAKLVSLNSWDDTEVLETIAKDYTMKFSYEKCIEELEKMKLWKVYENVCLFNILLERGMASGYARNEDLIQALDNAENQLNYDFPIYYSLLKKDFNEEIDKQRLIKEAAIVLNKIFNFHDPFHYTNLKILNYLSEEDLIRINENK